jgi:hypothetical protein
MNCCDDFGNCNQGPNCPVRVARVGQRMKTADPLPQSIWRDQLRRLGYWVLMIVLGLTVWPVLAYLVLRA